MQPADADPGLEYILLVVALGVNGILEIGDSGRDVEGLGGFGYRWSGRAASDI